MVVRACGVLDHSPPDGDRETTKRRFYPLLSSQYGTGAWIPCPVEDRAVADPPRARRSGGRGRRRLSVDQRRDELIATALELFGTRSPEDVSIDDVAATARASRALVYHYFGGTHELYLAALGSAAKRLSALLEAATDGEPLERSRVSPRRYFDFVESHAAGYTALSRGGPADRSSEVGEIIDGIRQLLPDRILRSLDVATPRPILRVTLRAWMAAVETAGLEWLEHRDVPRPQLEGLLIDQLVAMFHAAGRHDPDTGELFDRFVQEGMVREVTG
ncbi:TetR/AcrR family transcriptional regulator [Actinomadura spongiicola]|uniref:TetR/AcrR family transcriptional regulator n=1 Tax=Actinomadura spongiicola TaxID=2303421 RepID=A0A372GAF8_9ACTN|nr:TetR/AcrR family transcriptional regulator [Actinomadura spongiicola]RFS82132.1 TetR/AcrR family transcriptional regulator [Actinomadura spongiicola]